MIAQRCHAELIDGIEIDHHGEGAVAGEGGIVSTEDLVGAVVAFVGGKHHQLAR